MTALAPLPLSFDEAKELTAQIKAGTVDLWELVQRAHEGKAWAAIGYPSWDSYVTTEFQMSKQRAHQLLDYAAVRKSLGISDGESTKLTPTEGQTRQLTPLKGDAEAQREAFALAQETAAATGKPVTAKVVKAAVDKVRAKRNGAESQLERDRLAAIARAVEPPPHGPEPTEPIDLDDDRGDKVYLLNYHWDEATDEERSKFLDGIIQNFRLLFIAAIARAK